MNFSPEAAGGLPKRLSDIAENFDTNPELSRRAILGLGAVTAAVTTIHGINAIRLLKPRREEVLGLANNGDICEQFDTACLLRDANLDVPPLMEGFDPLIDSTTTTIESTTTTVATTTTTTNVTTTTILPPTTQPLVEIAAEVAKPFRNKEEAYRRMAIEDYEVNAETYIANLPSLPQLHERWPGTVFFKDPNRQIDHIAMLNEQLILDPEEFSEFDFDYSKAGLFPGRPAMNPRLTIDHWTGQHYDDPEGCASSMTASGVSVQFYRHKDNTVYLMTEEINRLTGHTLHVNDSAIGFENYSGTFDHINTPLYQFDVEVCKKMAYAKLKVHHLFGIPVNMQTMITHLAADLIFVNPYYNPATGEFFDRHDIEAPDDIAARVRKFDFIQEFPQMLGPKIIALNEQVTA